MRHKRVSQLHSDGLSPNGKALDSDSSIFQVRILVAQFVRRSRFDRLFYYFSMRAPFILRIIYATKSSADALSLDSIHNGTKFAAAKLLPLIKCRCISTVCLSICCIYHPYLHFDGSHINYRIKDRIFRLICLIKYIALHTLIPLRFMFVSRLFAYFILFPSHCTLSFRFAPCSCRAGALYTCMHADSFASKLARIACMQVCSACRNAQNSSPITREALRYAAEKIRTPDTLVRSQVLYPAELRPHLRCVSQQMIFYRRFQ